MEEPVERGRGRSDTAQAHVEIFDSEAFRVLQLRLEGGLKDLAHAQIRRELAVEAMDALWNSRRFKLSNMRREHDSLSTEADSAVRKHTKEVTEAVDRIVSCVDHARDFLDSVHHHIIEPRCAIAPSSTVEIARCEAALQTIFDRHDAMTGADDAAPSDETVYEVLSYGALFLAAIGHCLGEMCQEEKAAKARKAANSPRPA